MNRRILITGSSGLVGNALTPALASRGIPIARLDIAASGVSHGDVRDRARLRQAMEGADGVIHLAAVSRVVWAERAPDLCWSTNVTGLDNILQLAAASPHRPWVIREQPRGIRPSRAPPGRRGLSASARERIRALQGRRRAPRVHRAPVHPTRVAG